VKKVIFILCCILVLFAPYAKAVTSSPGLLQKLDDMWKWAKQETNVTTNAKRPPIFISTPEKFDPICRYYAGKKYDCDRVSGFYRIDEKVIHVREQNNSARVDRTIIHEMTHALQHIEYGSKYMLDPKNNDWLEIEAHTIGDRYVIDEYGLIIMD